MRRVSIELNAAPRPPPDTMHIRCGGVDIMHPNRVRPRAPCSDLLVHPTAKTSAIISEKQRPTYGGDAHLAVDLHPSVYISASYYLFSIGEQSTATVTVLPHSVVQTLRLNWAIQLSPLTRLYVQLQQDLKTTAESANSRFFGGRVSHVFF